MADIKLLENLGLTEDVIAADMQGILRHTMKNEKLEVVISSISPIPLIRSGEVSLKTQQGEVYEIAALVSSHNLTDERFVLRRGRKARAAYSELSPKAKDYSTVLSAARKEVSLLLSRIEPTSHRKFATSNEDISIFPPYHATAIMDSEFEKKGFNLWKAENKRSVADRVVSKTDDVNFMDFVNVFNPYILLHDLAMHDYENALKKLLPEKSAKNYVNDFMEYIAEFYGEIREQDKKSLRSNLEGMVKTYFMPKEMRTIIHNSHPYDNREVNLVNPDNLMFGPRAIDIGSILGWPQIFQKISPETISTVINGFYLDKRKSFYKYDVPFKPETLDPKLLEAGSYLGGIYTTLREARNFNTSVGVMDEVIKEQFKRIRTMGSKEAGFIYGILLGYAPRIIIPMEERKVRGNEWQG